MFCEKCGEFVESGENYCPHCGTPQKKQTETEHEKVYECEYGNKVNKLAYVLLSIFLAPLGIHKFYAKRYKLGVVYLILTIFTVGIIPFILGLIEGIMAACKESDGTGNITISDDQFFL